METPSRAVPVMRRCPPWAYLSGVWGSGVCVCVCVCVCVSSAEQTVIRPSPNQMHVDYCTPLQSRSFACSILLSSPLSPFLLLFLCSSLPVCPVSRFLSL